MWFTRVLNIRPWEISLLTLAQYERCKAEIDATVQHLTARE